ncbi:hypothetical protein LJC10_02435 [Selenomonadales bacterium OttesenSCG-928-I06]|nr:hypothetical protein [Selenomonadales bacterium OttesenSCG-928-I06]
MSNIKLINIIDDVDLILDRVMVILQDLEANHFTHSPELFKEEIDVLRLRELDRSYKVTQVVLFQTIDNLAEALEKIKEADEFRNSKREAV